MSPIGGLADELFAVHMLEHLLIGDVGSLLLVLGLTGPLLAPVLKIRFFDRLRILTNPLIALPLWALDFYAWHAPALQDAAVNQPRLHALQHRCSSCSARTCGCACSGRCPSRHGSATARSSRTSSPCG